MCGICGIVNDDPRVPLDPAILEAMSRLLAHRGPDDSGTFLSPSRAAGLAHRRLSIIDLAGGRQPMSSEDGRIRLVANGEIYNFRDLRASLIEKGHRFATASDSEVILHLYEEHGPECVSRLRGMFAFAIWDDAAGRLVLARDRLGKKPLFWHHGGGRLVFASTIAAVVAHPAVPREVDATAVDQFLAWQYVPHPRTIFRSIRKLEPGHVLVYEKGEPRVMAYWQPRMCVDRGRGIGDWCDELRARLTEAVRLRLVSDVPLGAFLSGGLDSSIVVGQMSKLTDRPVKTFSIGFPDTRYDERPYARIAAQHFGTEHREFVVDPQAVRTLPYLVHHYGEPFGDSSAIPTFHLSRVTREHVKVALTGDAGDELFLGYPRYTAMRLAAAVERLGPARRLLAARAWDRLPASVEQKTTLRKLRKFAAGLRLPPAERYCGWIAIFNADERRSLFEPAFAEQVGGDACDAIRGLQQSAGTDDPAAAAAFADLQTYLPDDLLVKVDVASMSVALEARSPFLDHEFVEFALTIPPELKLRGLDTKRVLKRAFADMLPPEIINRGKMGFGVPISSWMGRELSGFVRETLLCPRALGRGRFRPDAVRRLVEEHIGRRADHGYKLWSLLNLELWEREFIDGEAPPAF